MEFQIELYENVDGKTPVLDFILGLNPKQQAKIYREIDLLEKFGNELHYPHVDTALDRMKEYLRRKKHELE